VTAPVRTSREEILNLNLKPDIRTLATPAYRSRSYVRPAKKVVEVKEVRTPYSRSRSYVRPSVKKVVEVKSPYGRSRSYVRPAKKVVEVKQVRNPYVRSRSYARPSAKLVAPIRYHPAERLERMRKPQAPVRQTRDQVLDIRPTRKAPAPYRHPYNNRYLRAASHHVSRPIRGLTLEGGSHGYRTEKKEAIVLADHKPIIVSEKGCTSGSCSLKNGGSHCTCKDGHDCGCEKKKLAAKEEKDAPCDKCAIKADIYNVKPVKLGCKSGECSLSLEDDDDEKKECDKKDPENCDCGCDASLAAKAAAVAEASAEVAKEVKKELVKKSI
jgi:hypothetical protein